MEETTKNEVIISAKTVEEFNQVVVLLNALSEKVRKQIKSAKMGVVGLECELGFDKFKYSKTPMVTLPFGSRQIQNDEDYIGVYVRDHEYYITIREPEFLKSRISYVIEEK